MWKIGGVLRGVLFAERQEGLNHFKLSHSLTQSVTY